MGGDLVDAAVVVVGGAGEPGSVLIGFDVGGDVDLGVVAGVEVDASGRGGDGDVWGVVGGEGAVEVALGGGEGGAGEGEERRMRRFMGVLFGLGRVLVPCPFQTQG